MVQFEKTKDFEEGGRYFFETTIYDVPALFSYERAIEETVPKGFFLYELCDDNEGKKRRASIAPWVYKPRAGGIFFANVISVEPLIKQKRTKKALVRGDVGDYIPTTPEDFFKKYMEEK